MSYFKFSTSLETRDEVAGHVERVRTTIKSRKKLNKIDRSKIDGRIILNVYLIDRSDKKTRKKA